MIFMRKCTVYASSINQVPKKYSFDLVSFLQCWRALVAVPAINFCTPPHLFLAIALFSVSASYPQCYPQKMWAISATESYSGARPSCAHGPFAAGLYFIPIGSK